MLITGGCWGWADAALRELATSLHEIAFDVGEASLPSVAVWVRRGLTAHDAAYVALAEERGLPLVSDDRRVLGTAPAITRPLTGADDA